DDTDDRDEHDEQEPERLGEAVVVATPEVVDEAPDDDEDPQHEQREHQQRPEDAEEWIVVSERHVSLLEHGPPARLGAHRLGARTSRVPSMSLRTAGRDAPRRSAVTAVKA